MATIQQKRWSANDDFIAIELRMQNSGTHLQFTDFMLLEGNFQLINQFPETTNGKMLVDSLNGYLPTPDFNGNDLYLPIVVTQRGTAVDRSSLGSIVAKLNTTPIGNELLCDGSQIRRDAA